MRAADWILLGLIGLGLFFAIRSMVRRKGCGCGCCGCTKCTGCGKCGKK